MIEFIGKLFRFIFILIPALPIAFLVAVWFLAVDLADSFVFDYFDIRRKK